ncbi:glycosyltransferase family protein [Halobacillus karajensis]|uniref:Capsule polysaccharide biosynthesis protein n=1 Tax=Halobacillus karajensis TaxID=195088 RepID=A0A024P6A1_9BACI|nr:CDP-glycerol glycerophosphotransferase family protein [Halobacillus karajensis]CDQ20648.1 Capsule polysaccharide biosynthesis protein [Halobacillus karajensis]CDQ23882.1 Capsule polysaccharide biosynthesis protein [Halobacillus karajensis]CDQ27360.1 Capsule polysaccharide biosynthesis protein [Halobacillus karajensis]
MDTFSKNYWGLYLDFLDDFKGLIYKGYPIAYLCHYRSLIRGNKRLMANLESDAFTKKLKSKGQQPTDVQATFNTFKANIQKKQTKRKGGKVVLHDVYDLLRFPDKTLHKHFNKSTTLILEEKGRKKRKESFPRAKGFTYQSFSLYRVDAADAIKKVKRKARDIIASHPEHPMYIHKEFQKRFMLQIEKIINRINESIQLFQRMSVSVIIVPSTHYPESRTLVMMAAKYGIPTVCMQHGIISGEFGYLPKIADIDAVYGPFEKDWFKAKGVKATGMEIIGHPRFDLINKPPSASRTKLTKKLGLDSSKRNVLLIVRGQKKYKEWDQFLKKLTVKQKVNIILKDFPNHRKHSLLKSHSYIHSSIGHKLYDLIHMSDVVVTYFSTVALEAMLAGKTVFILDSPFGGYSGYFSKMGKLSQEDPKKLATLFSDYIQANKMKIYADRTVKEFVSYAYPTKQSSSKRLMNLLKRWL